MPAHDERPTHARRAVAGDETIVRAVRLEALTDDPHAFGSTLARELARTEDDWRRWVATGATFTIDRPGGARGLVAARHADADDSVVQLMAMWVHADYRGRGAGDALVNAVIDWAASENARVVRLLVVDTNARARRFYERMGFRLTGHSQLRERDGAIELQMERPVAPRPGSSDTARPADAPQVMAMSNDVVYATGLLTRALDPATQPAAIRAFMQAEIALLEELIPVGAAVLDVGCGTGRHLARLRSRVRLGVGVDYEHSYIVQARREVGGRPLHFVTGDATRLPLRTRFDFATCVTNTWGTMSDQRAVLDEMRRCAPRAGTRLVSVFAEPSVPARREWYSRFGHAIAEEAPEYLLTEGGLRSEHFTQDRLRSMIGPCTIRSCGDIAYFVTF